MINIRIILIPTVFFACINLSAQTPGTTKWEFFTGNFITSSPAIGVDGTVYVGSRDNKLYAINPDGSKKWEFATGSLVTSSPAIGIDETVYVGSEDYKLYAINPNGTKKWEFLTGYSIGSSPAVGNDGTIYVGCDKLYAVNPDGTKKWEFSTGSSFTSSPAIGIEGTVYVGSWDNKLYAINPDGTKKWAFSSGSSVTSSPAIGADGTVYVGSDDHKLYAINPDGTKKWEFLTSSIVTSSPAIGIDGTVYIGSWDNKIYAINLNGTKKWEFSTGNFVYSSPAIGIDGKVYVGSWDNKIYAINPDGTKKWEFSTGSFVSSSPAIGIDGTIYVGSADNKLYAIYSDCGGLASSCWPKYRKNNANNGNVSSVIYSNNHFYAFMSDMGTASFETILNKELNKNVTITQVEFDNQDFHNALSLPYTINAAKTNFIIPVTLSNTITGLHTSGYKITYKIEEQTLKYTDIIETAVIADNNSELSDVGKRAIDAYHASLNSNQIAAANNKAVIYRLLGEYEKAESQFERAVSLALENFYGFTGIKMNQGVVMSDKRNSTEAMSDYSDALEDLTEEGSSVIAPQIDYNQAWEYYRSKLFSDSKTKALLTINHQQSNSFLKAKAYILLGLNDVVEKDTSTAITHMQNAVDLDPKSCIAEIAKENICILNTDKYERVSICQGESYGGRAETGQFIRKLESGDGTVSFIMTILTVNPKYESLDSVAICEGESYKGWTTSGEYVQHLVTSCKCDSTITTVLKVSDCASGLEERQSNSIIIYPNPSQGEFELLLNDNITRPADIRIYNSTGMPVFIKEYFGTENAYTIQLQDIPKGLYFIRIKTGELNMVKKLVIN